MISTEAIRHTGAQVQRAKAKAFATMRALVAQGITDELTLTDSAAAALGDTPWHRKIAAQVFAERFAITQAV